MLSKNIKSIKIKGKQTSLRYMAKRIKKLNIDVPGDPSSAAFYTALTLLNKDSSIKINNICLNKLEFIFTNY